MLRLCNRSVTYHTGKSRFCQTILHQKPKFERIAQEIMGEISGFGNKTDKKSIKKAICNGNRAVAKPQIAVEKDYNFIADRLQRI
ncbi:MAG: hypothetical protein Q4C40_02590 [Eubacteriales bacterium]|nr:hypothetical protein [Eubacteriales bacterium]